MSSSRVQITLTGLPSFRASTAASAAPRAGARGARTCTRTRTRPADGDLPDEPGLESLFDARVDALVARAEKLPGKPAPDTFLRGAAGQAFDEIDRVQRGKVCRDLHGSFLFST